MSIQTAPELYLPDHLIKLFDQSFSTYAPTDLIDPEYSNITARQLQAMINMPFWWGDGSPHDDKIHDALREKLKNPDAEGSSTCCFVDYLGRPMKYDQEKPIFDYQLQWIKDLWTYQANVIWKAGGLGATTLSQYYLPFQAISGNYLGIRNSKILVITGPRIELAKGIIAGIKEIFKEKLDIQFRKNDYEIRFPPPNKVQLRAYPSNEHIDAIRSLKNVSWGLFDEADFVNKNAIRIILDALERYIGKSNVRLLLISTPKRAGFLLDIIQKKYSDIYHIKKYDYRYGLNKVYRTEDIEKAKKFPSFRREYCCEFLGGEGNVFSQVDLDWLFDQGHRLIRLSKDIPEHLFSSSLKELCPVHPSILKSAFPKAIGIDPAFGSSAFGVCILALRNGLIEVCYAQQFERADFLDVMKKVLRMATLYRNSRLYIDANASAVVSFLKKRIGRPIEQMSFMDNEDDDDDDGYDVLKSMSRNDPAQSNRIIPVAFNPMRQKILQHAYNMVTEHRIISPSIFEDFHIALDGATTKGEYDLDKEESPNDDLTDAFTLACMRFALIKKQVNPMETLDHLRNIQEYHRPEPRI